MAALWAEKEKKGRKGNFKSSLESAELPRQLIKLTTLTETAHCKQQPNKAASSQMADDQATAATGGGEGESMHESLSESLAPCIPAGLDKCCCQSMMGAANQLLSPQHPCCSSLGGQRACAEQRNLCACVQAQWPLSLWGSHTALMDFPVSSYPSSSCRCPPSRHQISSRRGCNIKPPF